MQTSRACSWVWVKSAECLQDLSKEEPLGHCHGNFDNPDRVQMWLSRAIWECLPPSSLSHCWGHMGLAYPFLIIYVRGKKSSHNFSHENLGPKIFYQKLHLEWEKGSAKAGWIIGRAGKICHFCITALLLYCLQTCLFTLFDPISPCCTQIWNMSSSRPGIFLNSFLDVFNAYHCAQALNRTLVISFGWMKRWHKMAEMCKATPVG